MGGHLRLVRVTNGVGCYTRHTDDSYEYSSEVDHTGGFTYFRKKTSTRIHGPGRLLWFPLQHTPPQGNTKKTREERYASSERLSARIHPCLASQGAPSQFFKRRPCYYRNITPKKKFALSAKGPDEQPVKYAALIVCSHACRWVLPKDTHTATYSELSESQQGRREPLGKRPKLKQECRTRYFPRDTKRSTSET